MTTSENPPRWAADPFGRHQHRYWDGAQWTEHVADDGRVALDPPVPAPAPPVATALGPPVASSGASYAPHATPALPATYATSHDPTAVLGRRYGAFLIDAAICIAVFSAFFLATATTHTRFEALQIPGCHLSANDSSQVECDGRAVVTIDDTVYEAEFGPFVGLCVLFTFLYFAVAEAIWRGSLGKQMTGLRVVNDDGQRIGIPRSMARWALFAIDGPLSLYLCGIITSAVSSGHRRLGDMGAASYVVAKADADRPVVVPKR